MKDKIKAWIPDSQKIREHKNLQCFGNLLHSPNLWHLNRRSVSGAFAVGLFFAFIPVPFQMLLAAGAAIFFGVNLPISVALVWISNPVTMPPLFYSAYLVGVGVLGAAPEEGDFELSMAGLSSGLGEIWAPFLLGCFIVGTVLSVTSYFTIRVMWRWHIIQRIKERKKRFACRLKVRKARKVS